MHTQSKPTHQSHLQDIYSEVEEEDFQTVSLNEDHWSTEAIPDCPLCIHKNLTEHEHCNYPCPFEDFALSDDSDNFGTIEEEYFI